MDSGRDNSAAYLGFDGKRGGGLVFVTAKCWARRWRFRRDESGPCSADDRNSDVPSLTLVFRTALFPYRYGLFSCLRRTTFVSCFISSPDSCLRVGGRFPIQSTDRHSLSVPFPLGSPDVRPGTFCAKALITRPVHNRKCHDDDIHRGESPALFGSAWIRNGPEGNIREPL
ncbi:hypothetical protein MTO96_024935 [Rhipicephalus appendiculatus]